MESLDRIIVFIGPSGAGKSTLAERLHSLRRDISLVRTYTTRPRRGDSDSSHEFVTEDTFAALETKGAFIGTLERFGFRYGLPRIPDGTSLVLLRASTIPAFKHTYPDSLIFEIDAPIVELTRRLHERRTTDRLDIAQLQDEIDAGRALADHVIDTSQPIDECLSSILRSIDD